MGISGDLNLIFLDLIDTASLIMQDVREKLEFVGGWSVAYRDQLAQALLNRYITLKKIGRMVAAKADLADAIAILTDAITLTGADTPSGWHSKLQQWKQWLKEI